METPQTTVHTHVLYIYVYIFANELFSAAGRHCKCTSLSLSHSPIRLPNIPHSSSACASVCVLILGWLNKRKFVMVCNFATLSLCDWRYLINLHSCGRFSAAASTTSSALMILHTASSFNCKYCMSTCVWWWWWPWLHQAATARRLHRGD